MTRCAGRASGTIGPIPAEPKSWNKYKLAYNQSAAELYFVDQYNRLWGGLVNLMAAYVSPSSGLAHTPLQLQIAALFRGQGVAVAQALRAAAERRAADARVTGLREQLQRAEAARAELDA